MGGGEVVGEGGGDGSDTEEREAALRERLRAATIGDLQEELRSKGLKISGKKADLVERLAEAIMRAEKDPGALVGGQFLESKSRDEQEPLQLVAGLALQELGELRLR